MDRKVAILTRFIGFCIKLVFSALSRSSVLKCFMVFFFRNAFLSKTSCRVVVIFTISVKI